MCELLPFTGAVFYKVSITLMFFYRFLIISICNVACVSSGGPEQPGRPMSRGYLHSPSPSLRTQDVVVQQQRPSIFQGKSVITSLM